MNKIFIALALIITSGVIVHVNGHDRPKTLNKDRYEVTSVVCAKTYYGPKTSHCEKWKTISEFRVEYKVDGLFFDYTTYRVVN